MHWLKKKSIRWHGHYSSSISRVILYKWPLARTPAMTWPAIPPKIIMTRQTIGPWSRGLPHDNDAVHNKDLRPSLVFLKGTLPTAALNYKTIIYPHFTPIALQKFAVNAMRSAGQPTSPFQKSPRVYFRLPAAPRPPSAPPFIARIPANPTICYRHK